MPYEWRNYQIYYTDVDRLIVECAAPLTDRLRPATRTAFWERHYAGGPHLRVRVTVA